MFSDIVRNDLQHGTVQVGVDRIPDPQTKGPITVNRHPRRKELLSISRGLGKKVNDLSAVNIYYGDRLPLSDIDPSARAGVNENLHFHSPPNLRILREAYLLIRLSRRSASFDPTLWNTCTTITSTITARYSTAYL